ncbi:MAG: PLDc N-terminal domain-containing protein [bacterium]|nr:PLDc N-terminal domain-containing protein [bacterium]
MLGIFSFFGLFYLALFSFIILAIVLWIIMLIDVVKRDFPNENDKTMWLLVVALTSWIGSLIYYFTIVNKDQKKKHK